MLTTMRSVLLKLPSSESLGSEAGAFARPFHAFSMSALRLVCPFSIVRPSPLPFPPRGGRASAA